MLAGESSSISFTDSGLTNAQAYFYVVKAVDAAGNVGAAATEASAVPSYQIGWANLQWPPTMNHTISTVNRTATAYGQVWIDGVTNQPGRHADPQAQLGFGPAGSNPADRRKLDAGSTPAFNVDAGNNDEFVASLLPEQTGSFDYVYRYSTNGGRSWLYADLNGPVAAGSAPANPGKLTVVASSDTTAPSTPRQLARGERLARRHRAGVGCGQRRCGAARLRSAAQQHGRRPLHAQHRHRDRRHRLHGCFRGREPELRLRRARGRHFLQPLRRTPTRHPARRRCAR